MTPSKSSFPLTAADLIGLRLLVIAIPESNLGRACFFSGLAQSIHRYLRIVDDDGVVREFDLRAVPVEGFNPANVLKCVANGRDQIASLVIGTDAAIAVFVETLPPGGVCIKDALYGLGRFANGSPMLVQGYDEDEDQGEED